MPRTVTVVALFFAGCGSPTAPRPAAADELPSPDAPGTRVLFVGNSLTSYNDVPELVRAMAAAGGVLLQTYGVTPGGVSLEDQWNTGTAREVLRRGKWDFVVLQQGPSTRPESRANLEEWAAKWGDEIRRHHAAPALYMVWPYRHQGDRGFELSSQSYRAAAVAAKGLILPAGEAWREAIRRDPAIELFTEDGLHPTPAGSYLAALVITRGLTGVAPSAVPARLDIGAGRTFELPPAQADALKKTAEVVAP